MQVQGNVLLSIHAFKEYKLRQLSKHSYYATTFALYKNDIKQTWSVIKDTLQRKKQSRTTAQFILNNRMAYILI